MKGPYVLPITLSLNVTFFSIAAKQITMSLATENSTHYWLIVLHVKSPYQGGWPLYLGYHKLKTRCQMALLFVYGGSGETLSMFQPAMMHQSFRF